MFKDFNHDGLKDIISKSRDSTNPLTFIYKSVAEIKKELSSRDKDEKASALLKLLFLYLNDQDVKWASFNTLEILTTCGNYGKRVGYLIGQLQYKGNKECLQLLPNLIRKEIQSQNYNNISSSLNMINNIMDLNLASEIYKDIEKLLNLNKSLIKKKIIVGLTIISKIFLDNNSALSTFWDDFIIKLVTILNQKDIDNGVAICIISSIQKICRSYPQKCFTVFLKIMEYFQKCEINWNLIKIIDIFGMLFSYDKRFTKQKDIIKAIAVQLSKTKSKSVEMQLVKLVICHLDPNSSIHSELFKVSEERLKLLLTFDDSNLVLISLRLLQDLFKRNVLISSNYLEDILKLLTNPNQLIQIECLKILKICSNENNFKYIIDHVLDSGIVIGSEAVDTIMDICTFDSYSRLINDMEWFVEVLFNLAEKNYGKVAENRLAYIIRDLAQRVSYIREDLVSRAITLFEKLIINFNLTSNQQNKSNIVYAFDNENFSEMFKENKTDVLLNVLSFVIGEYCLNANQILKTISLIQNFLQSSESEAYYVPLMNSLTRLVIKGFALKIENIKEILFNILALTNKKESLNLEVIDCNLINRSLMNYMINSEESIKIIESLIGNDLKPIDPLAQESIKLSDKFNINECFEIDPRELEDFKMFNKKSKKEAKEIDLKQKAFEASESLKTTPTITIDKTNYMPDSS